MTNDDDQLLSIVDLKTYFFGRETTVQAVDGVNLDIRRNTTVCVVGESGCGKSITARSILGLVDRPGRTVGGQILWHSTRDDQSDQNGSGSEGSQLIDLAKLDPRGERMRQVRGREISMIFQEPMASLSPMHTIGDQLVEAIRLHIPMTKAEAWQRGIEHLERVGIPRPDQRMNAYSFQLSGGMCQRAMIAIALACEPDLLIADEPTTALDVTTQARVLDLIRQIQQDLNMSILFITHDLGVVAEIADEVAVMYLGKVVERGSVDDIFHAPQHPYTQALLRSIPAFGLGPEHRLEAIGGIVPHPRNRPAGCAFHPRCDAAMAGVCDTVEPAVIHGANGSAVKCHLYDDHVVDQSRAEEELAREAR